MTTAAVPWTDVAERLRPFVAHRVPSSEIDDVVQDVLVRMHRGLPDLREDDRFSAWMFQVARNAIADSARKRVHAPQAGSDLDETPAAPTSDDDREAATALAGCVSLFVAQLPSPYREAITLVELEGKTAKEAAEMVGISVSGMKSRVQRGRAQLRELFERCCEIAVDVRGKPTDFTPRCQPSCKTVPRAACASSPARTHRGTVRLRALLPAELPAVRALLAASDLPTDDIDDPSISLVGAFDDDALIGVVGLQACGEVGLLRSLAVAPSHRDRGIARALCERVFELAGERAMESLWLLTTSAKDYFTRRGFEAVPREEAAEPIRTTAQFTALCPSSAHVMHRR